MIAVPPGLPKLADLERLRIAQSDALPFEGLKPINFCFAPPPVDPATINVDRSLFVHDTATLTAVDFSLRRTLGKIASDAAAAGATGATAETLFRDLWDTQNPQASAATPTGAQCDVNGPPLNGFPNVCRPTDGAQAKAANLDAEMATYQPVGIVNRLDLAAEGWKNCGEHRIVYGRVGAGVQRSFIIFEAVLPNPRPGCESGCRAVADHWFQLSSVADPVERAKRLEQLFYTGLPGYEPVVRLDHYAAKTSGGYSGGSGQIRTNQFLESPWMLKEFKLALDCTTSPCLVEPVPIPVKVNPDGTLWTETTLGLANEFQQNVVLPQVTSLGVNDINKFSYQVALQFDATRSQPQSPPINDFYSEAYTAVPGVPGGFRSALVTAAAATSPVLTDTQIVNRATALSCAGCHMPSSFGLTAANSIGPGMSWPNSATFVHVKAEAVAGVHALSSALTTTFLPARAKNLASMLSDNVCFCRFRKLPIDTSRFEQVVFAKPPATLADIRTAEVTLKQQIDTELTRQKLSPLPDLAPETRSTPLVLDEVKAAGPDPAARSAALRTAVQKLVASEPPRKTVTGHFRTE
ncbi:MAG TPA: hypothetical protein VF469_31555 [Kofleriaceae bacterium]